MGVSFRMDGWLGNSGFQPDGEGAVGTGRASIGGIRSLQSTQSRKSTQSTDFLDSVDSIDSIEKKTPTSEARRQKRPEWSGNVLQPDGEDAVGTGSAGRFPPDGGA